MKFSLNPNAPDRRLLDEGRRTRAMTWIMSIMLFLTVLAGALGLGMLGATAQLDRQLSGRPITARAIATRCCSPPDSVGGLASIR